MNVCIIGNGLSSLTLAKALVNQNIHVTLISQNTPKKIDQSRTLGISKNNVEYFKKDIINIDELLWKIKKIEIYTDNLKNEKILNFENNNKEIFSILKNSDLYEFLDKQLKKNKLFKKKLFKKTNFSLIEKFDIIINCNYFQEFTQKYFSNDIKFFY